MDSFDDPHQARTDDRQTDDRQNEQEFDPARYEPTPAPASRPSFGRRIALPLKLGALFVLCLVLLMPVSWLLDLVRERKARSAEAQERIHQGWGGEQTLVGPLLVVPYAVEQTSETTGLMHVRHGVVHLLPVEMTWNAELEPEVRHLGIFESVLYRSTIEGQGLFDLAEIGVPPESLRWSQAKLALGLGDAAGLAGSPELTLGTHDLTLRPGVDGAVGLRRGVHGRIDQAPGLDDDGRLAVAVRVALDGSRRLRVSPSGGDTSVTIASAWNDPSFVGSHLPRKRTIDADGFRAEWHVPALARTLPALWHGNVEGLADRLVEASFGVELVLPAGGYQRTERAAKYALLFVGLTFLAFFLFEVLAGLRVHAVQYLLVGAALVLFYLLLLALSEHVPFTPAYLVASLATSALVSLYARAVLGGGRRASVVFVELLLLYGYLWVVLAAEDFALLFGSVGLFVILGLVMWVTRGIDWYDAGRKPLGVRAQAAD